MLHQNTYFWEERNVNWKKFWLFGLILALGLFLVACGSGATDNEPTAGEAATSEPTAGEPAMEVTLRWRTRPDNQEEANVYNSVSQKLDAQLEGITLVYEPGGSETASYQDVLKTEIGAGTAPDVFWIPGTDVADFATRGLILNPGVAPQAAQ